MSKTEIYIGTILLEKSRWAEDKTPTFRVSEWAGRFADAGFDGMELWECHATLAGRDEVTALEASGCPVAVFNSYASMDDAGAEARRQAAELTRRLGARGVKFNVGRDPQARETYVCTVREWGDDFAEDVRLLCECHSGTIIEEPKDARRFFEDVGGDRWQVIVHAFSYPERLDEWFDEFGERLSHVHVQLSRDGQYMRLERWPERVDETLEVLTRRGFAGTYTLEFTEGTRTEGETMGLLWDNALRDLEFLRGRVF
jgi:sugar phosphate isomerase/epimerase